MILNAYVVREVCFRYKPHGNVKSHVNLKINASTNSCFLSICTLSGISAFCIAPPPATSAPLPNLPPTLSSFCSGIAIEDYVALCFSGNMQSVTDYGQ